MHFTYTHFRGDSYGNLSKMMSSLKHFPGCARPFSQAIHKKPSYILKTFPRCARALLLQQSIRKGSIPGKSFRTARGRLCQDEKEEKRKRRVHNCFKTKGRRTGLESTECFETICMWEFKGNASDSLFRHVRTTLPFLPVLLSGNFLRLRTGMAC